MEFSYLLKVAKRVIKVIYSMEIEDGRQE